MATEQTSSVATESRSLARWSSWLAALVGLWVLVSPFVLEGGIASGTVMWSNAVSGVLVAVLAGYGAWRIRETAAERGSAGEWSGWIAALAGVWILLTPFVLTGSVGAGTPMYGTVIGGVVALVLAAAAGYAGTGA